MTIISKIAQMERKFAWSFLGFLLAIVFGGMALYIEFFRDNSPIIKYQVISNTKILDVKEDVGGLSIIYNNEDIKKAHKTLSILAIKISNEGRSAILKSYYDNASPLGFTINSGDIIKGEVINASTQYLYKNEIIRIIGQRTVEFSEVIIEPNESFITKFLILNPENTTLSVTPKGKIAGVKKITIVDQLAGEKDDSFFFKVVSGSIGVQLMRVPIYLFGFMLAGAIIMFPIIFTSNIIGTWRKNKIIKQFNLYTDSKYEELNQPVYDFYKNYSIRVLLRLRKFVADNEDFTQAAKSYKGLSTDDKIPIELVEDEFIVSIGGPRHSGMAINRAAFIFKNLIYLGIILEEGEKYSKNEQKIHAMNEFIEFALIKET